MSSKTATSEAAAAMEEGIQEKKGGCDGGGDGAPQTNGITDARVNANVDVDIALVTDNNTTTTKRFEQSSSNSGTSSTNINPVLSDYIDIDSSTSNSTLITNSAVAVPQSVIEAEFEDDGPIPKPKFRLESSGTGDSSVTVGVASLTSSSSVQVVEIPDCCEGPSSEDMKLSLVSWYSEPDDSSRLLVTSSTGSCCEGGGRQTISLTGSLSLSKSKSGSEEKENQTPEPSGLQNGETSSSDLLLERVDSEMVGSRESVITLEGEDGKNIVSSCSANNNRPRNRMHVQLVEEGKNNLNSHSNPSSFKKETGFSSDIRIGAGVKPECFKCTRRSKSGNNTPVTHSHQIRTRTPASRRLMPSTKSSTELKKPIKSILKSDSNSRSGSGSDNNKSSMDSLPSGADLRSGNNVPTPLRPRGAVLMSRSESSTRAKFNLNHEIFTTVESSPSPHHSDERIVSKLRRIEKYATLRFRKTRIKPLELGSDSDINNGGIQSGGVPTPTTDLMTKSMSFLEKGGASGDHSSLPYAGNGGQTSSLQRQASLRMKKGSPQPCTTRTTALRLQKMHEAKAKKSGAVNYSTGGSGGSVHTGSTHSGSGESIHHVPGLHNYQSHSAPANKAAAFSTKGGEKLKVFAKLSSAVGQTASSNQKRLKQEKSVQTDVPPTPTSVDQPGVTYLSNGNPNSMSPIPSVDATTDLLEQIRQLEKLANRYRNTALRFQCEFEKSEAKKSELTKQLQEAQTEASEMIEFLQAEKSTLAESLTEIETEAMKWREQIQTTKKESDSRISTLVRLSEQHKQEALKSHALLHRLEAQSNTVLNAISNQISEGTSSIVMTRQKVNSLTECLIKTYQIPQALLSSFVHADTQIAGLETLSTTTTTNITFSTQPNSSLLLPLITSLAKAFPTSANSLLEIDDSSDSIHTSAKLPSTKIPHNTKISNDHVESDSIPTQPGCNNDLLQTLNQAILERESAEAIGLDQITVPQLVSSFPEEDEAYLTREVVELNTAVGRLLLVIRVIVVQSDKRVSKVASSILQCLQSEENDKGLAIPHVTTKSSEPMGESSSSDSSHHNGNAISSSLCKSSLLEQPGLSLPQCENGHPTSA